MSRRIPLIAGGVVMVLMLGWYVALWRPATSDSRRALAAQSSAQVLQTQMQGNLSALVGLQRTVPLEEAKLRGAETAVPSSVSVASVIDQIDAVAVAGHIAWTNESQSFTGSSTVAPAATAATTASTTAAAAAGTTATTAAPVAATSSTDSILTLSLDVSGTYAAMARFITTLSQRPRLIVIDTLSYSPGGADAVTATIGARAFYNTSPLPNLPRAAGGT